MGSAGEPLYLDVSNVIANSSRAGKVTVIGGRYGLASKDTDTAQIVAVFDNLAAPEPTRSFTIGINDDVTNLSLPVRPLEDFEDGDTYSSGSSGAWAATAPWARTTTPSASWATAPTCTRRHTSSTTPRSPSA